MVARTNGVKTEASPTSYRFTREGKKPSGGSEKISKRLNPKQCAKPDPGKMSRVSILG